MTQFHDSQQKLGIALLEQIPWADTDNASRDMEAALRLALGATANDFNRREEYLGSAFEAEGYDEFSFPAHELAEMDDSLRPAGPSDAAGRRRLMAYPTARRRIFYDGEALGSSMNVLRYSIHAST